MKTLKVSTTARKSVIDKIQYYLEHEDKRRQIAENGYEIAHRNHKYIDRIKIVLEDLIALT